MLATVLILMNFLIIFGTITLPHLANPLFLWLWLGGVTGSLFVGGIGMVNLIRAGFFKRLRERESRLRFLKSDKERQMLGEAEPAKSNPEPTARLLVPNSVTESTTRELEVSRKSTRKVKIYASADYVVRPRPGSQT